MARYAALTLLVLLIGYGVFKAGPLVLGPEIILDSPIDHASYPDGFILLSGTARNTENLIVNGGPLLIDQDGRFSTELTLPRGGAILTFTATDRFGRSHTVRRTIYAN